MDLNSLLNSLKKKAYDALNDNTGFIQKGKLTAQPVQQAVQNVQRQVQQSAPVQGAQMYQRAFQSPQVQRQAVNFGQNIYKAVNAPYDAVNRQMAPILQQTRNMPMMERVDTVLPQAAKAFSSNMFGHLGDQVINPTLDLGYQGIKSYAKIKQGRGQIEDVGNIVGGIGAADIPGNIIGGGIGATFQAGANILGGQQWNKDLGHAYDEGYKFTAKLGPLGKLAETPLKPLLNKINPEVAATVNQLISKGNYKQAANLILRRASATAVKEGTGFGAYNFTLPAKDIQARLEKTLEGIGQGAAFGFGTSAGGDIMGAGLNKVQGIYKNKPRLGTQEVQNVMTNPTRGAKSLTNNEGSFFVDVRDNATGAKKTYGPYPSNRVAEDAMTKIPLNQNEVGMLRSTGPSSIQILEKRIKDLKAAGLSTTNAEKALLKERAVLDSGLQSADLSIKLPVAPQVVNGKIKMKPIESPLLTEPNMKTDGGTRSQGYSGVSPVEQAKLLDQSTSSLPKSVAPKSGLDKIGNASEPKVVTSTKDLVKKLYTQTINRFQPLEDLAKQGGKEKDMRYALSQHYGVASTGDYHVDYELSPILKSVDANDLRSYTIAQRDLELANRNIKGSDTQTAQKIIDGLSKKYGGDLSTLQSSSQRLYDYQKNLVKTYLVDQGIVSPQAYEEMVKNNQSYVPFKRVMDQVDEHLGIAPKQTGVGSVGSQNAIYKIKGSDKQIVDPLQSIIENTYKIVSLGKRNQVARTIASLSDVLPDVVQPFKGEVGRKPVISVFENGKVKKYLVPEDVAIAAKGLDEEPLAAAIKILAIPTRVLRASATGINPEFQAPNVVRDLQSAFVNAGTNPLKFVEGLSHLTKQDDLFQEYLRSGARTSSVSLDRDQLAQKVISITSNKGKVMQNPVELLRTVAEYSEQPTRIAVFKDTLESLVKKGVPREEALKEATYQAQEATVNFARRGSKTKSVNALIAFLNARAQGTDRLLRSFKNDPKGVGLRLALISQVPTVLSYLHNRSYQSFNDDRIVSPTDKQNNFIIMLSDKPIKALGGAQYIKIPKGDIGKFGNPTEAFMSMADGKNPNAIKAIEDAFLGLSPVSNLGDVIPTAIRPPIENASNHSFFTGREIVPDYKKDYPAPDQYANQTPPIYRAIGDRMDTSPAKLQNLVEGYGTGLAKMAAQGASLLVPDKFRSQTYQQGATINNTPVVRRFLGGERKTAEEQQASNDSARNSITYQINDIKSGIKKGRIDRDRGIQMINDLMKRQQSVQITQPQTSATEGIIKGVSNLLGNKASAEGLPFTPDQTKTSAAVSTSSTSSDGFAPYDFKKEDLKNSLAYTNGRVLKRGSLLGIKGDDGSVKVFDLGNATPTGNAIQQAKQVATHQSQIGSVGVNAYFSQKLSDSDKNEIYKALGTNAQDVEFKALASLPDDKQASVLYNLLNERQWSPEKMDTFINKDVLTSSVASKMEDQGLINSDQASQLKAYIKSASVRLGKTKGSKGSGAKIKIAKPKIFKPKTIKISFGRIKSPKPRKLAIKSFKITKAKNSTLKIKKF